MNTFKADKKSTLLPYLLEKSGITRTRLKKLLSGGAIRVNGKPVTQHDHALKAGDRITLGPLKAPQHVIESLPFPILHEDKDLVVIDKPAGLLSIATEDIKDDTAYFYLTAFVRSKNPDARVFIVHRLDRETSGLMVFAKTEAAKLRLQEHWEDTAKTYMAVVEGKTRPEGTVESYLAENKFHKVYSTENTKTGKHSITDYVTKSSTADRSLLEVHPKTGRKNQIRVHLSDIGHPIVGDDKYGATSDPVRRLALHASALEFAHPTTKKKLKFESPLPPDLKRLV